MFLSPKELDLLQAILETADGDPELLEGIRAKVRQDIRHSKEYTQADRDAIAAAKAEGRVSVSTYTPLMPRKWTGEDSKSRLKPRPVEGLGEIKSGSELLAALRLTPKE